VLLAGVVFFPTTLRCIAMRQTSISIARKASSLASQTVVMAKKTSLLELKEQDYRTSEASRARRKIWGDLLASVAAAAPPGIYLNTVQIDSSSWRLQISGSAVDMGAINRLVGQMNQTGAITNANVTQTGLDENSGQLVRFQISALSGMASGAGG
jgi:Tfp pilus assembly protein PilN